MIFLFVMHSYLRSFFVSQDPEKGPAPAFLPFQRSVSTDEEPPDVMLFYTVEMIYSQLYISVIY